MDFYYRDKLEEQSRELERLRKQLSAKEEMERRQIDAVCQLNITNQRLEQMVKDTNAENAELEGKMSALKNALDTAYRWVSWQLSVVVGNHAMIIDALL